MKRLCTMLFLLAITVASFGLYRGWFTISGGRGESNKVDVNLTVDPGKIQADAEAVKEKATEFTHKTTQGAAEFGNR